VARLCLHLKICVYILSFALRDRMARTLLSDEVWKKVRDLLPGKEGDRGGTASNNRWFLEAMLWIARTGSPWRDLPAEFGRWHTVYIRFSRWRSKGVWPRVVNALAGETEIEIEHVLIDSTIVRVHQHSARALKKRATGARSFPRRAEHQTASGGGPERSSIVTGPS
jgi:transposase